MGWLTAFLWWSLGLVTPFLLIILFIIIIEIDRAFYNRKRKNGQLERLRSKKK